MAARGMLMRDAPQLKLHAEPWELSPSKHSELCVSRQTQCKEPFTTAERASRQFVSKQAEPFELVLCQS